MVAFHFPPYVGSSGVQRTLRFAEQLPHFGWRPVVLTATPRAYGRDFARSTEEIAGVTVERCFALDAAHAFSLMGRYPRALAMPDRWSSWAIGARWRATGLLAKHKPAVIWSTYPIATAHLVGGHLSRIGRLPWVADFRDTMVDDSFPRDERVRRAYSRVEATTLRDCARAVMTAPGAVNLYASRYPAFRDRLRLIANGYDEESFQSAPAAGTGVAHNGPRLLLHSGVVYPHERDPRPLFDAIRLLRAHGQVGPERLRLRFRASGHDAFLAREIERCGLADMIEIAPALGYKQALGEMLGADGLLLLQGDTCNHQIPAKLYEYLRAGRPILGLACPVGDTAAELRRARVAPIVPLEDAAAIGKALLEFVAQVERDEAVLPDPGVVAQLSRVSRTQELGALLDEVSGQRH